MNKLAQVFADTNVSVRTVLDADGEVWFGCTDVAKAVGYADTPWAVSNLMPDRKELCEISTYEFTRGLNLQVIFGNNWKHAKVINLEMLNDFLMDSGKPQAKAFRKWVTGTVMLEELEIGESKFGQSYLDAQNKPQPMFVLPQGCIDKII